jgi:TorA maturation chaperone TorD
MGEKNKAQNLAAAKDRSQIYGLLTSVYREESAPNLLQRMKDSTLQQVLAELGIQFGDDFLNRPEEDLTEDLAVEFARLFLGPGRHISPHESVHSTPEDGEQPRLWSDSTVKVKNFIESTGLNYDPGYTGLPDHISVELEFMELLARREEQAWSEDDEEGAWSCLDMERRFLEEHLISWVPTFCDKVMAAAELSFYRQLAGLTKTFIEFDWQQLQELERSRTVG